MAVALLPGLPACWLPLRARVCVRACTRVCVLCLYLQVPVIAEVFTPAAADVARACDAIEQFAAAPPGTAAVLVLAGGTGEVVEIPVVQALCGKLRRFLRAHHHRDDGGGGQQ